MNAWSSSGGALLTIHSAKGLEDDTVVVVVGCEEKLFPHWCSIDDGVQALREERRLTPAPSLKKR